MHLDLPTKRDVLRLVGPEGRLQKGRTLATAKYRTRNKNSGQQFYINSDIPDSEDLATSSAPDVRLNTYSRSYCTRRQTFIKTTIMKAYQGQYYYYDVMSRTILCRYYLLSMPTNETR